MKCRVEPVPIKRFPDLGRSRLVKFLGTTREITHPVVLALPEQLEDEQDKREFLMLAAKRRQESVW